MNRFYVSMVVAALTGVSGNALAQSSTRVQVDRFEPLGAQGSTILNVATSDVMPHGNPHFGLFAHYMNDALVLRADGEETSILGSSLKTEFSAGIGLWNWLDISVTLPLVAWQDGELGPLGAPGESLESPVLGDVRVVPRIQLVNHENWGGFGFGVVPMVSVPTGTALNTEGDLRFEPRAVLDWRHNSGFQIATNIGYSFRGQEDVHNLYKDDVVRWSVGTRAPIVVDDLNVVASFFGDVPLDDDINVERPPGRLDERSGNPLELAGGLEYGVSDWVMTLGGGAGLNAGFGAPDFRVFLGIGYTPLVADMDGDGIIDSKDSCPNEPEDVDGYQDSDGCPDLDNDGDGINDADDQCPNEPEDLDGFEDEDGCPDPDNDGDSIADVHDLCPMEAGVMENQGCPIVDKDGDGILDADDKCPEELEDKDGFEDEDGCPDPDNDADGIPDAEDKCPDEAEDMDGFMDDDGCPDLDNDADGIPDTEDKCPNDAETINGVDDEDGCPDKGASKVKITTTKIEILDRVYFDTGKATIKNRSYNLLNQVASILKANPQVTKLQIEGHTDNVGNDEANQKLSQERADSVKVYLSAQGIEEGRLEAIGYGESKPIADNANAAGRDQNRRVEFTIAEVNGKPVSGDGPVVIEKEEVIEEGAEGEGASEEEKSE